MFIRSALFIIVVLIILILISPVLMATTFGGVLAVLIFAIFYAQRMRTLQKDIQNGKSQLTTVAEESWSNVRTVKAFSNEREEINKFEVDNGVVFGLGRQRAILQGIFGLVVQILLYGSMVAVMYVASLLY